MVGKTRGSHRSFCKNIKTSNGISGIYAIVNCVNGKLYIGSSNNIRSRWIKHHLNLVNNRHTNKHLQSSWNKKNNYFKFIILEIVNEHVFLLDREQYWVDLLETYNNKNGYNIVRDVKRNTKTINHKEKVLQYDFRGDLVKEWDNFLVACGELDLNYEFVMRSCKGECTSAYNYIWVYKKDNFSKEDIVKRARKVHRKIIYQWSLDLKLINTWTLNELEENGYKRNLIVESCHHGHKYSKHYWSYIDKKNIHKIKEKIKNKKIVQLDKNGLLIKIWNNMTIIEKLVGIKTSNMSKCCNGEIYSCMGFIWIYLKDYNEEYVKIRVNYLNNKKTNSKKINQYDLNGNFIKTWKSLSFAMNSLNLKNISGCLSGKCNQSGGYIWRYANREYSKEELIFNKYIRGKKIIQISKDNKIIKIWNSSKDASRELDLCYTILLKKCKNNQLYKGYYWQEFSKDFDINKFKGISEFGRVKKIAKIDKDTNKILCTYDNARMAMKSIKGIEISGSKITECCNKKRKTAYGYKWSYHRE